MKFKKIVFLLIFFCISLNISFADDENLTLPDYYWPISGDFVLALEDTVCSNVSIDTRIYNLDELAVYQTLEKYTAFEEFNVSIYYNGTIDDNTIPFYEFESRTVAESVKFPTPGRYLYRIDAFVENNYGVSWGNLDIKNCTVNDKTKKIVFQIGNVTISSDSIYVPEVFSYEEYTPYSFDEVNSSIENKIRYINISLKNQNMIPKLYLNNSEISWYYDDFKWNEVKDNEIPLLEKRKLKVAFIEGAIIEKNISKDDNNNSNTEDENKEDNNNSEESNENNSNNNNNSQNNTEENNENTQQTSNIKIKPKEILNSGSSENENLFSNNSNSSSGNSIIIYLLFLIIGFGIIFGIVYILFKPNTSEIVLNEQELEKYHDPKSNLTLLETKMQTFADSHSNVTKEDLISKFSAEGFTQEEINKVIDKIQFK